MVGRSCLFWRECRTKILYYSTKKRDTLGCSRAPVQWSMLMFQQFYVQWTKPTIHMVSRSLPYPMLSPPVHLHYRDVRTTMWSGKPSQGPRSTLRRFIQHITDDLYEFPSCLGNKTIKREHNHLCMYLKKWSSVSFVGTTPTKTLIQRIKYSQKTRSAKLTGTISADYRREI